MGVKYASISYTGDGSTINYSIQFPFISESHIHVLLNDVETTDYTIVNSSTVQFNTAPANGVVIKIYRDTSRSSRIVDFANGNKLTDTDLDNDSKQGLFAVQEAFDSLSDNSDAIASNKADIATNAGLIADNTSAIASGDAATLAAAESYADMKDTETLDRAKSYTDSKVLLEGSLPYWEQNTQYLVDTVVFNKDDREIYHCLTEHTSSSDFSSDTANWEKLSVGLSQEDRSTLDNSVVFGGNVRSEVTPIIGTKSGSASSALYFTVKGEYPMTLYTNRMSLPVNIELVNNATVTNVPTPTNDTDAANKAYVDANSGGGGSTRVKDRIIVSADAADVTNGDADYSNLDDAISAANEGDTIILLKGEHTFTSGVIDKMLNIQGSGIATVINSTITIKHVINNIKELNICDCQAPDYVDPNDPSLGFNEGGSYFDITATDGKVFRFWVDDTVESEPTDSGIYKYIQMTLTTATDGATGETTASSIRDYINNESELDWTAKGYLDSPESSLLNEQIEIKCDEVGNQPDITTATGTNGGHVLFISSTRQGSTGTDENGSGTTIDNLTLMDVAIEEPAGYNSESAKGVQVTRVWLAKNAMVSNSGSGYYQTIQFPTELLE